MVTVNIKTIINADIKLVWDMVTSMENYEWRSDLDRIEVLDDGKSFNEITKDGYSTNFKITVFEEFKRYEFDIENKNISGSWVGVFTQDGDKTIIDFTENVRAKNIFGNVAK